MTFSSKLVAQPLKDPDHQKEAQRFLTACTSLLNLLEMPNIRPALLELRKVQDTTIGNLLGFMSAFNLRFGPATSPSQRQVYSQLFQILNQTRDRILAEAKLEDGGSGASRLEERDRLLPESGSSTFRRRQPPPNRQSLRPRNEPG